MKKYAQITNGVVDGILESKKMPDILPTNRLFVDITGVSCNLGCRYEGGLFIENTIISKPEVILPTIKDMTIDEKIDLILKANGLAQ